jgi:hypothetical protein
MAAWNETQAQPNELAQIALAQHEQGRMYLHSRQRAVVLPFWQAVASGGFVGVFLGTLVGVLTYASGAAVWWKAAGIGLVVAFFAFLLAALIAWFFFVNEWRAMVWQTENFLHRDIDGDGYQGQPAPPQTVRVEMLRDAVDGPYPQTQIAELPTSKEKMTDLARGVLGGTPFSEPQWSGAGALFSRNEFRQVRDVFLSRGWVRWKDDRYPQQGLELSPAGKAVMRTFASEAHSPTLSVRKA